MPRPSRSPHPQSAASRRRAGKPSPRARAGPALLPAPRHGCGSAAVPLFPLPAPLGRRPGPPPPADSDRLRVPPAPRKTHTVPGTRPGYPAHSNKQTETRPVAKPTDGKLSNDFFFQVLKRQGAPGEGKKGASISRPGREGARSCSRSGSVRPSVLPDDGTGTQAGEKN
ncbi:translation initiation factor IF-2-like isoform X1 [Serinus canaria]|uniref:translation initiation factor IF-2-like isoform X1 n=1 Tax=Serinus canaria TaxID=9135 RepID=UPI0021CC678A|nr:translation initiation factor IF-2-like isoform X1 [Serinus canaria]